MSLSEDGNLLRLVYDAEVKKMLGYIASAISSFAAQLTMFMLVVGRSVRLPAIVGSVLAVALCLLECYFLMAIVTKYQNIVILENELGITQIHSRIYPMRSRFAKFWDSRHRIGLGIQDRNYERMNLWLDVGTIVAILVVILLWSYVLLTLFSS
jgi:hypothetical protein